MHPDHPSLPRDPRTLLDTSPVKNVLSVAGGEYSKPVQYPSVAENNPCVTLQVNIDGLSLFKISSVQF